MNLPTWVLILAVAEAAAMAATPYSSVYANLPANPGCAGLLSEHQTEEIVEAFSIIVSEIARTEQNADAFFRHMLSEKQFFSIPEPLASSLDPVKEALERMGRMVETHYPEGTSERRPLNAALAKVVADGLRETSEQRGARESRKRNVPLATAVEHPKGQKIETIFVAPDGKSAIAHFITQAGSLLRLWKRDQSPAWTDLAEAPLKGIPNIAFSCDSKLAFIRDSLSHDKLHILDVPTGKNLKTHSLDIGAPDWAISLLPNGKDLLLARSEVYSIEDLVHSDQPKALVKLPKQFLPPIAVDRDLKIALVSNGGGSLLRLENWRLVPLFLDGKDPELFAISPDKKTIAAIFTGNKIAFFSPVSGELIKSFQLDAPYNEIGTNFMYSPDGSTLLVANHGSDILLVDVARKKIRLRLPWTAPRTHSLTASFALDGRVIVALYKSYDASEPDRYAVFDAQTGEKLIIPPSRFWLSQGENFLISAPTRQRRLIWDLEELLKLNEGSAHETAR